MDRINGAGTIDIGGGRRGFRDENLVAGIEGTEVTALWLNAIQEELLAVIQDAGLAPSAEDWTLLLQALRKQSLKPMTADKTYWVRSDGNDNNDGSANDPAHAFSTLLGAYNSVRSRTFANGYKTVLQLGTAGNYVGLRHDGWPGQIEIKGDAANRANYRLTPVPGDLSCVSVLDGRQLRVSGVSLVGTPGADARCAWAFGGSLELADIDFRSSGVGTLASVLAEASGNVTLLGAIDVYFARASFALCIGGASVYLGNSLVTALINLQSDGLAFDEGFIRVSEGGRVMRRNVTISGFSATGKRYAADLGGIINVSGGGENFFPGSLNGTLATGGQYS
ncbi:hypothetical protein [Rhizobium sp.]|uniref:hypothetical protein n=1 Tax=Rhizobium sp. TaxID=391 RepID=UPI003F82241A